MGDGKGHTPSTSRSTRCTETHAYGITHVGLIDTPPCKLVTVDVIATKDDAYLSGSQTSEKEDSLTFQKESSDRSLEIIETLSDTTQLSGTSGDTISKPTQLLRGNEFTKDYAGIRTDDLKGTVHRYRDTSFGKESSAKISTDVKSGLKIDHVYEEVGITKESGNFFEYDILDYYEKYSPTTAKTLINTLFLPRHKVCRQCASFRDSPVYTDCWIYAKEPLYAREVELYQQEDSLCFRYCSRDDKAMLFSQYDNVQDCMPVYNCSKTNCSSIFYLHGLPEDIFDLRSVLGPHIFLMSGSFAETPNTQLYHRSVNDVYARTSKNGCMPMTFRLNHEVLLSSIKQAGYGTDLQNWMNYRNDVLQSRSIKQEDAGEHQPNRASLLLLEPLLLMPELRSPRYRPAKNRLSHSEHMKIVRIVIAYTLSFFILAIITFYIVYFT
ncbi:hypothetical protein KM043_012406 [Ampulex compressa]|nr:hypothetical protein KM043_012406 [Ampulex compressa]